MCPTRNNMHSGGGSINYTSAEAVLVIFELTCLHLHLYHVHAPPQLCIATCDLITDGLDEEPFEPF